MPRIGDFWAKHPDVPVTLSTGLASVDLRRDGFDLAIRFGNGDWPGLQSERLSDGNFWAVVRPDMLAGATARCLADVRHLPWLLETEMAERRILAEQEGIDFDDLTLCLMHTNSLVIAGVQAGLGVTIQPRSLVEDEVRSGVLTKVCELGHPTLGYHIVRVPDLSSKTVTTLVNWLRHQAKD